MFRAGTPRFRACDLLAALPDCNRLFDLFLPSAYSQFVDFRPVRPVGNLLY
jgi:hypothetical protein